MILEFSTLYFSFCYWGLISIFVPDTKTDGRDKETQTVHAMTEIYYKKKNQTFSLDGRPPVIAHDGTLYTVVIKLFKPRT